MPFDDDNELHFGRQWCYDGHCLSEAVQIQLMTAALKEQIDEIVLEIDAVEVPLQSRSNQSGAFLVF